jgi:hypothetical protein
VFPGGLQGACPRYGLATLRVLGINHFPGDQLPEDFGQLTALRFLNLSDCRQLRTLPGSFSRLAALQTLNLWSCHSLVALPDLNDLKALRKLVIRWCLSLVPSSVPAFGVHPHLQVAYDGHHLDAAMGEGRVSHVPSKSHPWCAGRAKHPMQLWVPRATSRACCLL